MKFLGNLVFAMIAIIVCIPIVVFAPIPFVIFLIVFFAYCIGMAIIGTKINEKNK